MTFHGVLPLYKPKGFTSHDMVAFIRKKTGQKKVGHTGTLDPEVEGVLPLCLGQATRVVEYLQDMPKKYRASLCLGRATDTEDQTGVVIEEKKVTKYIDIIQVEEVLKSLIGVLEQIPPMYSAVKWKGRRLYELAREGKVVERPKRRVVIYDIQLIDVEQKEFPHIIFEVLCSKGTYIRTLCVEIGKRLGYPAHMNSLIRTKSGPFSLEDCYTVEEIHSWNQEDLKRNLIPIGESLGKMPSLIVSDEDCHKVFDGWMLEGDEKVVGNEGQLVRVYSESGLFLAIYRQVTQSVYKPEKVFREVES